MGTILGLDQFARSNAPALIDDNRSAWITYRQLVTTVARGAEHFGDLGRKTVLFIFGGNVVETAITYLAALEAGAAVALFGAKLPERQRQSLIDRYRPDFVAGLPPEGPYAPGPGIDSGLPLWRRTDDTAAEAHPALALLLSTSGSTGSPKLVRLARTAVAASARSICQALGITSEQRSVLNLPLSYSYGLSVLNSHLAAGASVLLTERNMIWHDFWRRLAEYAVTSMPGVPHEYELLLRHDLTDRLPPSLSTLTQAGGKLSEQVVARLHDIVARRSGRLFVMYGQTEAAPRISVLDSSLLPEKLGSVGRPVPGGRIEIAGNGSGPEGEVVYYGPNVMMGYAETAKDLALGDILGGRLETGDLGRLDSEGFLYITGRRKRIAKINGLRINLDEVEAQASRVGTAAAMETTHGLVVFSEGADEDRGAELRRWLAREFGLPLPRLHVRHITALPILSNGKIDRQALERLL